MYICSNINIGNHNDVHVNIQYNDTLNNIANFFKKMCTCFTKSAVQTTVSGLIF